MATPEDRLSEIEARIRAAISRFRSELELVENALHRIGPPPTPPPTAPPTAPSVAAAIQKAVSEAAPPRPGLLIPKSTAPPTAAPPPPSSATIEDLLNYIIANGLKSRSYDIMKPAIAPQQISSVGAEFDAGEIYDAWIIIPSVDTRISFSGPPNENTPFLGAGQAMNFNLRARKVYYLAALPTLTGTLSVWLAKYKEG
jgi:hypothetical protein